MGTPISGASTSGEGDSRAPRVRRVLLAPDSFKESMGARAVCEALASGLARGGDGPTVVLAPMADGGEGTRAAFDVEDRLEAVQVPVRDPLRRTTRATYSIDTAAGLAIIETAEACGMERLAPDERDPHGGSTFGAGELFMNAVARGVRRIVLAIGGSATVDGGMGMARALGYTFLDSQGEVLGDGGLELLRLGRIVPPSLRPWESIQIDIASDVDNPLLGPQGAARIYARQKGRPGEEVDVDGLEAGLRQLADVIEKQSGLHLHETGHGGAAGGMGAGLCYFIGSRLQRGFDVLSGRVGLREKLAAADLVITGEGRTDGQTLRGKVCQGVADLARELGVPCCLVSGRIDPDFDPIEELGVARCIELSPPGEALVESIRADLTARRLADAAAQLL